MRTVIRSKGKKKNQTAQTKERLDPARRRRPLSIVAAGGFRVFGPHKTTTCSHNQGLTRTELQFRKSSARLDFSFTDIL